jgi:hypothetical protein
MLAESILELASKEEAFVRDDTFRKPKRSEDILEQEGCKSVTSKTVCS